MIGLGMEVYFRSYLHEPPYAPYYDAYKGHKFRVVDIHPEADDHLFLVCITGDVKVAGCVHAQDLKRA